MSDILQRVGQRRGQTPGQRIRRRRQELGMSQVDLARRIGVSQGYLSALEKGRRRPGPQTLQELAQALQLPPAVIIGANKEHDNPQPYEAVELPLFGSIPAGPPSESQEAMESWPVLEHLYSPDYYCLRLSLDSMEPTLKPGDIVLVHFRPEVSPLHVQGRICACLLDGQATMKRVSVDQQRGEQTIVLRGDNPQVPPITIQESQDFLIQGVVVKLVSREL